MSDKAKIAISTVGAGLLFGAMSCMVSTAQLIKCTWVMAVSEGATNVVGYIVATGIVSVLAIPAVALLCIFGVALTASPWSVK
jgi:hypothetical protein